MHSAYEMQIAKHAMVITFSPKQFNSFWNDLQNIPSLGNSLYPYAES